jgi:hypothetical protein
MVLLRQHKDAGAVHEDDLPGTLTFLEEGRFQPARLQKMKEQFLLQLQQNHNCRISNSAAKDANVVTQYVQAPARARSRAIALRGVKLFLWAATYLPTSFAMSAGHDALARMLAVSANSAIRVVCT